MNLCCNWWVDCFWMVNTDILVKHRLQIFTKAFCPEKGEAQTRRKIVKMSEGYRRHSIGKLFA